MLESKRKLGRPRSDASRRAILDAAFALLAERGYTGLTLDAVAEAAGTGKTTIYRWWRGKADLSVEAFFEATTDALAFPDTKSARDDFRVQIGELSALLRGSRGAVFAAMLGGARIDKELAKALGEKWLDPRRKWGFDRMSRAILEGECHYGIGIQAALGILYGPLYTPLLFGQPTLNAEQTAAHLAIALAAIFKDQGDADTIARSMECPE